MAVVRIPDQDRTLRDRESLTSHLASIGIHYEHWDLPQTAESATPEELLSAFGKEVESLKAKGRYQTADVIDVNPNTPGLETMLAKFNCEHWHEEDEVRFIVDGRGLFHIHPENGPLTAIEVEAGDLICVPRKTRHWFDLCGDRRILAIRLFQDTAGWTPHYTSSGVDKNYQPVCLGPTHIPLQSLPQS